MAYVITDACIKDLLCVDACPTDCIHPKKHEAAFETVTQLFVDPNGCIDCGACVPACTSHAIHPVDETPRGPETLRGKERRLLYQRKQDRLDIGTILSGRCASALRAA